MAAGNISHLMLSIRHSLHRASLVTTATYNMRGRFEKAVSCSSAAISSFSSSLAKPEQNIERSLVYERCLLRPNKFGPLQDATDAVLSLSKKKKKRCSFVYLLQP